MSESQERNLYSTMMMVSPCSSSPADHHLDEEHNKKVQGTPLVSLAARMCMMSIMNNKVEKERMVSHSAPHTIAPEEEELDEGLYHQQQEQHRQEGQHRVTRCEEVPSTRSIPPSCPSLWQSETDIALRRALIHAM
jgi:hypothetical protein